METTKTIEIGVMLMGLFGGLAIFLYGMEQMDNAMKRVAGERMKSWLATLTTNRFTGAFAGAVTTAVVQSSSVTTVLVVGFVSAGLMNLIQSIGVIMGANIGTTITAQIVAFKITKYALWMVAAGFLIQFISKKEKTRQYGIVLLGLGLVFFGLTLMSGATKPLRSYEPFILMLQQMGETPILGILVGAAFTSIVQSSSATTGIIIVLASQGLITLDAGIALAFGANLGTCITAMLAAIGRPREAVQAAVVHVLFNVAGVVLWFFFIPQLAAMVTWMSPTYPELAGTDKLAAETPRQIANAHTMFNIINTGIFIWFVGPIAKLVQFLVPERRAKVKHDLHPTRNLDAILLETPSVALGQIRMEVGRLGICMYRMVQKALPTISHGTEQELESLAKMNDKVNELYGEIFAYLSHLSREELLDQQSIRLSNYMIVANYTKSVSSRISTNLVDAGKERLEHDAQISEVTQEILAALNNKVTWAMEGALNALNDGDTKQAKDVVAAKPGIVQLINNAEDHLERRLVVNEPDRAVLFRTEFELLGFFKRTYFAAERIAQVAIDVDAERGLVPIVNGRDLQPSDAVVA